MGVVIEEVAVEGEERESRRMLGVSKDSVVCGALVAIHSCQGIAHEWWILTGDVSAQYSLHKFDCIEE